jgi:phage FluMu gp28-like protein
MTQKVVEQEVMGKFIEDVGSVFRGVDDCIMGALEEPVTDHKYYVGVDLAKSVDFTVMIVLNKRRQVVAFDRFNQLDWTFQKQRIINMAKKYNNAKILLDSTGVGDPILDDLKKEITVEGYKFTSASKADLINKLAIHINERTVTYPRIPELLNELKIFGYIKEGSKEIKYSAPEGYHDDTVIALSLALMNIDTNNRQGGVAFAAYD